MIVRSCLFVLFIFKTNAQLIDDFTCPDQFEGFYPHLYSCDKYWKCLEGRATLELCGNGLAFDESDPTFTTENCDYREAATRKNMLELCKTTMPPKKKNPLHSIALYRSDFQSLDSHRNTDSTKINRPEHNICMY